MFSSIVQYRMFSTGAGGGSPVFSTGVGKGSPMFRTGLGRWLRLPVFRTGMGEGHPCFAPVRVVVTRVFFAPVCGGGHPWWNYLMFPKFLKILTIIHNNCPDNRESKNVMNLTWFASKFAANVVINFGHKKVMNLMIAWKYTPCKKRQYKS